MCIKDTCSELESCNKTDTRVCVCVCVYTHIPRCVYIYIKNYINVFLNTIQSEILNGS